MNPTHLAATVLAAALMFAACAPDPVIGSGELQGEPTSVPDAEREPAQEPAAPLSTPTPVPPPTPAPSPTPQPPIPTPTPQPPTVSDEVPSVQELLDLGLTEGQAQCFITTVDPEGTGRVQDVDLLIDALSNCT